MSERYGLGSSHYSWSAGLDASYLDPLLIKPHTSWRGVRGARVNFGADGSGDLASAAADQAREIIRINFPRIKASRSVGAGADGEVEQLLAVDSSWKRMSGTKKGRRSRIWDSIRSIADSYEVDVVVLPGEDRRSTKFVFSSRSPSSSSSLVGVDEDLGDDFDFDTEHYGSVESEVDDLFDELDAEDEYGRLYMGAEYHELGHAESGDLGVLIGRSGNSGYRGGRPSFGLADVHTPFGSVTGINDTAAFFLGAGALLVFGKAYGAW